MKKIVAYTMVLVTMTLLAGCGKKKVEYVENKNLASDTDGVDAGIMFDSLAEQIGAPERWDGEYEGNDEGMTGIDVLTEVNLDGITGVNVSSLPGVPSPHWLWSQLMRQLRMASMSLSSEAILLFSQ